MKKYIGVFAILSCALSNTIFGMEKTKEEIMWDNYLTSITAGTDKKLDTSIAGGTGIAERTDKKLDTSIARGTGIAERTGIISENSSYKNTKNKEEDKSNNKKNLNDSILDLDADLYE